MSNHALILSSFFFLDEMVLALIGGKVHYQTCLGMSSYGPVYSGVWHQGESSIPCAIKFPNCQAPSSLQASTRVKREAELVLTLIHPNIVQHLEVVPDSSTHIYANLSDGADGVKPHSLPPEYPNTCAATLHLAWPTCTPTILFMATSPVIMS